MIKNTQSDTKIPSQLNILIKDLLTEHPQMKEIEKTFIHAMNQAYDLGCKDSVISRIDVLENTLKNCSGNLIKKPTYAEKINASFSKSKPKTDDGDSSVKPAHILLLYPKDPNIALQETLIKSKLKDHLGALRINRLHSIKKGGVLIETNSKEELDNIMPVLSTELVDTANIRLPNQRVPELRIKGISPDLTIDDIIPLIVKQNNISAEEATLIKECKIVTTSFGRKDAILITPNPVFEKLLSKGKVFLGYSRHNIMENFLIKSCRICLNTGHTSTNCNRSNENICKKCGDNHESNTCTSSSKSCWRCGKYSHLKSPPHNFASNDCIIFQNELKRLRTITNYHD